MKTIRVKKLNLTKNKIVVVLRIVMMLYHEYL